MSLTMQLRNKIQIKLIILQSFLGACKEYSCGFFVIAMEVNMMVTDNCDIGL